MQLLPASLLQGGWLLFLLLLLLLKFTSTICIFTITNSYLLFIFYKTPWSFREIYRFLLMAPQDLKKKKKHIFWKIYALFICGGPLKILFLHSGSSNEEFLGPPPFAPASVLQLEIDPGYFCGEERCLLSHLTKSPKFLPLMIILFKIMELTRKGH